LHFNRSSSPSECVDSVSIPAFCVIAQGSKEVLLGSAIALQYDPMHYLLATIELPIVSQILKGPKRNRTLAFASISTPHLSVQSWLRRAMPSPQRGANVKARREFIGCASAGW
jgi:hypothetical protein